MPENRPNSSHIQSVARALELVNLLASENREMSLTELSNRIGRPKSTVHGLISTLRDYHFIEQSPITGHYFLGVRLFELGNLVARNWDIRTASLPVMQRLNDELGEMVQLAMEDGGEVLYLEKVDSTHMMRIVSEIGSRLPMHCSGLGKAMLAYKKPGEVRQIIARHGMRKMTSRTIVTMPELEQELLKIRSQGYAIDDREIMDGLRCVAAPVFNREGSVPYALSISGFVNSMQGANLDKCIRLVKDGAKEISRAMGYR